VDAAAPVQEHSGIVIRAIADIFKYKKSQTKINVRLFGMKLVFFVVFFSAGLTGLACALHQFHTWKSTKNDFAIF
jgi:hypothetical protein